MTSQVRHSEQGSAISDCFVSSVACSFDVTLLAI